MTDRVKYLTVVLKGDVREDDAQPIIEAISLLKGVASVGFEVADPDTYTARQFARNEIREQIMAVLWPER